MPAAGRRLVDRTMGTCGVTAAGTVAGWVPQLQFGLPPQPPEMRMALLLAVVHAVVSLFFGRRAALVAENLALRHQLTVLQRSVKRPVMRRRDRIFRVILAALWADWRSTLLMVSPDTVVRWHHYGYRLFWRWRSLPRGGRFPAMAKSMGIEQIVTGFRSPKQNAHVERLVGSIRRECLDHIIVLNESHLRRVLREYQRYYNEVRPHLSLGRNAPVPRPVQHRDTGPVCAREVLGGLHHHYFRKAAQALTAYGIRRVQQSAPGMPEPCPRHVLWSGRTRM